jgi:cell pole-organizing protein PopZ
MSQPAKAPEPTIDEILASIRRSIVPDGESAGKDAAGKPPARKSASRKPEPVPSAGSVSAAAKGADGEAARADPGAAGDQAHNGGQVEVTSGDAIATAAPNPERPLLSPRTTAAVDTAFHSLAHTVLSQNPRTLEDLVRDMLKPMLKEWLDANLPDIVERLVRAEIERVSRRG